MGMYDVIQFDEDASLWPLRRRHFQTKSLERCMDCYIVTKEGRLCLVSNMLLEESARDDLLPETTGIEFHGDIRLVSDDGRHELYMARFTHGTLEWVRPAAEVRTHLL